MSVNQGKLQELNKFTINSKLSFLVSVKEVKVRDFLDPPNSCQMIWKIHKKRLLRKTVRFIGKNSFNNFIALFHFFFKEMTSWPIVG